MPSSTGGEIFLRFLPEGMNQRARSSAFIAFDPEVFGLQRRASLEETQGSFALGRTVMNVPAPRKIVEVAVPACEQKTGGNRVGVFALLTVGMHEMGLLRPVRVGLDIEQARIVFRQQAAFDAPQPTREGADGNSDSAFRGKGIYAVLFQERGHSQSLNLGPQHSPDVGQQTRFIDRRTDFGIPAIQPHGNHGNIRKVYERARPVCPKKLTWPYASNDMLTHIVSPSDSSTGFGLIFHGGSPESLRSSMISRTPGSTSRIDIGAVKLSHAEAPGFFSSATRSP